MKTFSNTERKKKKEKEKMVRRDETKLKMFNNIGRKK